MVASFRKRVVIQTVSQVTDGQGGFTDTWNNIETVYASIEPMKAYERFQAMQMQVPVSHKIVMRYHSAVTTSCRLTYQSRIFWVKEIINIEERGRFLKINAIERGGSVPG